MKLRRQGRIKKVFRKQRGFFVCLGFVLVCFGFVVGFFCWLVCWGFFKIKDNRHRTDSQDRR